MIAFIGKVPVFQQRLSDIARSHNHRLIMRPDAEYAHDFLLEAAHLIAVPLLPKAAEAIEITPDLGRVKIHFMAHAG